jgi:hypothetical protein
LSKGENGGETGRAAPSSGPLLLIYPNRATAQGAGALFDVFFGVAELLGIFGERSRLNKRRQ